MTTRTKEDPSHNNIDRSNSNNESIQAWVTASPSKHSEQDIKNKNNPNFLTSPRPPPLLSSTSKEEKKEADHDSNEERVR